MEIPIVIIGKKKRKNSVLSAVIAKKILQIVNTTIAKYKIIINICIYLSFLTFGVR